MPLFQLPVTIQTDVIQSQGVTIYYPRVTHMENERVQESINQSIYHLVQALMAEQQKYQTGTSLEMIGHYEIKTNERGILSLILSNYAYSYPMAHGFTLLKSLTFDVNTGRIYTLPDLFTPGSDYVGFPMFPISVYELQHISTESGPLSILSVDIA